MAAPEKAPAPAILQWLLDTRSLWPVTKEARPRDEITEFKTIAARALALLPITEQESVLRYYHVKDARMSLASHLLKHLVITKHCNVPWSQATINRDSKGKPCFEIKGSEDSPRKIDFNVSHQAGIVTLIASVGFPSMVEVGTDVVCANERIVQDYAHIDKEGFFSWVDMHADVFADSEVQQMKLSPVKVSLKNPRWTMTGYAKDALSRCQWRAGTTVVKAKDERGAEQDYQVSNDEVIDAKLRRFYTMWCLREAYVKMTGDALLAPWLKELEILNAEAPAAKAGISELDSLEEGELVRDFEIFFKGNLVSNVKMEVFALGSHYMVAGSVRGENTRDLMLGRWEQLSLEDVLNFAESSS